MDNQTTAESQKPGLSRGKRIALGIAIGTVVFTLCGFGLLAVSFLNTNPFVLWRHLEISAADIPMYPGASDIVQQGPAAGGFPEVYTWTFASADAPEVVWKFYVEEMRRRWGFREASTSDSGERGLIVESCPFYTLSMSNTTAGAATYSYTIRFGKEPCR